MTRALIKIGRPALAALFVLLLAVLLLPGAAHAEGETEITAVTITITPPECGLQTETDFEITQDDVLLNWNSQTNPVQASVSGDECVIDTRDGNLGAYWVLDFFEEEYLPYSGEFLSTETVCAEIWLTPQEGYCFAEDLSVTVNGAQLLSASYQNENSYVVYADVTPAHENGATLTHHDAQGEKPEYWHCSACRRNFADRACTQQLLVDPITLTIHWSSIDGVDLMDPIVIENIESGVTFEEAMAVGGLEDDYFLFEKEGYIELGHYLPAPMTEYTDSAQWREVEFDPEDLIDSDTEVYSVVQKYIYDPITIAVEPPLCGSETTVAADEVFGGWDWRQQTNPLQVTVTEGKGHISEQNGRTECYWVQSREEYDQPFIGKFAGGQSYVSQVNVAPDYGYWFPENDQPDVTVVGGELVDAFSEFSATIYVRVTAEHDWGPWITTKAATSDAAGEQTRVCAANPEHTQTRPVSYVTLYGDGNVYSLYENAPIWFEIRRIGDDTQTFDRFVGVEYDGQLLTAGEDYIAKSGSLILQLQDQFADTLPTGDHTLTVLFDDAQVEVTFKTVGAVTAPQQPEGDPGDWTRPVTPHPVIPQPETSKPEPAQSETQTTETPKAPYTGQGPAALLCAAAAAAGLIVLVWAAMPKKRT